MGLGSNACSDGLAELDVRDARRMSSRSAMSGDGVPYAAYPVCIGVFVEIPRQSRFNFTDECS